MDVQALVSVLLRLHVLSGTTSPGRSCALQLDMDMDMFPKGELLCKVSV
jgi:hypothetical protein